MWYLVGINTNNNNNNNNNGFVRCVFVRDAVMSFMYFRERSYVKNSPGQQLEKKKKSRI